MKSQSIRLFALTQLAAVAKVICGLLMIYLFSALVIGIGALIA